MKKINIHIDGQNGEHFRCGHEAEGIIAVVEVRLRFSNEISVSVGTSTQLLALELLCQHRGYQYTLTDEDGNEITMQQGQKIMNHEYIFLDLTEVEGISLALSKLTAQNFNKEIKKEIN